MNNNYKILVIDDSQTMYKILVKNLALNDITIVDYAPDGESGIKIAKVKNYDLITIDIDMPGIDGFKTTEEILKLKPNQKILFISSKYNEINLAKAEAMGIKHFLPKPFSPEILTSEINSILV